MPLPAIGAILGKLATVGKAVAGKVAAGAAAKGVATTGAQAAAAGGAAAGGAAVPTAGKAVGAFAKFMAAKELTWDVYTSQHVLSDAAQGGDNARQYTRMLGGQQAAQQLPQDLPMGRKAPRVTPQDKSGLWNAPVQSQRVLPSAAPAPPRPPKIPAGGPPPTGAKPRGFFENVGDRFNQWRQARAAQAAAPQQLKMPSTRIPKGADFQEKLQKVARHLSDTDPIRSNAPSLPTAQDDRDAAKREAEEAEHGKGALGTTVKGLAGLAVGGGLITLPYALHKATQAIEQWTTGIMESHRPMERLNAAIATTFARLERQQLVLTARTAQATGGTTVALGEELAALREEMQPLRESATQLRNLVQIGLARGARYLTAILTYLEKTSAFMRILKSIDDSLKKEEIKGGSAWVEEIYKKLVDGDFESGANHGPGQGVGRNRGGLNPGRRFGGNR